jgi:hypothetical protein
VHACLISIITSIAVLGMVRVTGLAGFNEIFYSFHISFRDED